jgi:hypothetical protein
VAKKPDGKIHWVKKDAYVMPVLPASLKIDPLVAGFLHMFAFLELSGDDTVDPDWAVEAIEHVVYYFNQLTPEAKANLGEQIGRVTKHARKEKWGKATVEFFRDFIENFGADDESEE